MAETITTKKFARNVALSVIAQIISLSVSFILTLIVPKFIDELQYAYWQTYVLYVGYVGVLHFGLLDGLVLRYSKLDYDEIEKGRVLSQFLFMLAILLTIITAVVMTVLFCVHGTNQTLFILVAVGMLTKNIVTYGSYMFQITNRISKYVILVISQRLAYGCIVVLLLVLHVNDFYWYCIADLCSDCVAIFIAMLFNREVFFGKPIRIGGALKELKTNISAGIILMLANWSAMLMTSGAKMIIEWRWDELVFGKVSFAFSVSNVFLLI